MAPIKIYIAAIFYIESAIISNEYLNIQIEMLAACAYFTTK